MNQPINQSIKSNQIKYQIKSYQIKSNQIKSNIKSNHIKWNQISTQIKSNQSINQSNQINK